VNTSLEELLPLLLLGGQRRDLLPLLLLLGDQESSGSGSSDDGSNFPTSFAAYLASLVGDYVRVSLAAPVDNGTTLVGVLRQVETDFIVLHDVASSGVTLGLRDRVAIPISNLVGIDRVPFFDRILPLLGGLGRSHS
jgi:hypothetical protein